MVINDFMRQSISTVLPELVNRMLADPLAELLDWHYSPIRGGAGEGVGLWRVHGTARQQERQTPWSLVLKLIRPQTGGTALHDWNYWRREACVYESTLLADLPAGFSTVRCYGIEEKPDNTVWLWLEDLGPVAPQPWSVADYQQAGYKLGQLSGHYLTGKPLPTAPWLSQHWLRQWLARTPGMTRLTALTDHPHVPRLYPADVVAGYQQLWDRREQLLTKLVTLPQTLCHMDAFPPNLLARPNEQGQPHLVAIDWAYTGIGAIGEDLAPLVFAEVAFLRKVSLSTVQANLEAAFRGYVTGLRSVGWVGDLALVRLGYLATALLRYGVGMVPVGLNIVTDPTVEEWSMPVFGHPLDTMIDYWVDVARWQLRLAEEMYAGLYGL